MSPPLVTHGASVKIPSSSSSFPCSDDTTTTHDLVNQLDENDVFCSRASSVTVMSDPDRVSLFSPFASPGMDTPIIRTHPFGIRTTPLSLVSPRDMRKGSQSESDSLDGVHIQQGQSHAHPLGFDIACSGTDITGQPNVVSLRTVKKSLSLSRSGDLSTSHSSLSSLKKHSPLIFSSGVPSRPEGTDSHVGSCDYSSSCNFSSDVVNDGKDDSECRLDLIQTISCPENSKCSTRGEKFATFDPTHKPTLSPDQTHFALPSHTSSSSLDSGYDQSLSLTDSSRDSCPEYAGSYGMACSIRSGMACSIRNGMSSNKNSLVFSNRNGFLDSSGKNGQNPSTEQEGSSTIGYQHTPLTVLSSQLRQDRSTWEGPQNGMCLEEESIEFGSELGHDAVVSLNSSRNDNSVGKCVTSSATSSSSDSRISEERTLVPAKNLQESECLLPVSDPECSLKVMRTNGLSLGRGLSHQYDVQDGNMNGRVPDKEQEDGSSPLLPSPLSPDPTNHQLDLDEDVSMSMENYSISNDPLKPLPPRKLKNHIREISGERDPSSIPNTVVATSATFSSVHGSIPSTNHMYESVSETNDNDRNSIPIPPLHSQLHTLSVLSSPPGSLFLNKAQQPMSLTMLESPCESEADSGRFTKTSLKMEELDSNSLSHISELSYDPDSDSNQILSSLRSSARVRSGYFDEGGCASSSPPLIGRFRAEDEEEMCSSGRGECQSLPLASSSSTSKLTSGHHRDNGLRNTCRCDNSFTASFSSATAIDKPCRDCNSIDQSYNGRSSPSMSESLSDNSLKYHHNPSLLHQQLHAHDHSLLMGYRPSALEKFDDFVDIPLPDLEEFHLDTPTQYCVNGQEEETGSHRQQMSDFGHSLFVGVSPHYLPDFVLHGTTETEQELQEKLGKDLAHAIKYPIIDEPVDLGVGIIASTDTWSVKLLAASKSVQTTDVIYGSAVTPPSKCVKQMLSSVKNMHAMRMPPDFCLSYVEDCLMSMNDQSILLANALIEKGGSDADLNEILPGIMEGLSISPSDMSVLLPLAAVNCIDPYLSARLNHLHMQKLLGRHFV